MSELGAIYTVSSRGAADFVNKTNTYTGRYDLLGPGCYYSLPVARTMELPALCWTILHHDMLLTEIFPGKHLAMLSPLGTAAMERGLLVQAGCILPGVIITLVFNLTDRRMKVKRGVELSMLAVI